MPAEPRFIRYPSRDSVRSRPAQTELISCLLPDVTVSWPQILHFPIFGNNLSGSPRFDSSFCLFFFFFRHSLFLLLHLLPLPTVTKTNLIYLDCFPPKHDAGNGLPEAGPNTNHAGSEPNPGASKLPVRPRSMQPRLGRPQLSQSALPRPRIARSINGALDARRDVGLALSFWRQDGLFNWLSPRSGGPRSGHFHPSIIIINTTTTTSPHRHSQSLVLAPSPPSTRPANNRPPWPDACASPSTSGRWRDGSPRMYPRLRCPWTSSR